MRFLSLLLLALAPLTIFAQHTRDVSLRYLQLDAALAYDSVRTLLAPDMSF